MDSTTAHALTYYQNLGMDFSTLPLLWEDVALVFSPRTPWDTVEYGYCQMPGSYTGVAQKTGPEVHYKLSDRHHGFSLQPVYQVWQKNYS